MMQPMRSRQRRRSLFSALVAPWMPTASESQIRACVRRFGLPLSLTTINRGPTGVPRVGRESGGWTLASWPISSPKEP